MSFDCDDDAVVADGAGNDCEKLEGRFCGEVLSRLNVRRDDPPKELDALIPLAFTLEVVMFAWDGWASDARRRDVYEDSDDFIV